MKRLSTFALMFILLFVIFCGGCGKPTTVVGFNEIYVSGYWKNGSKSVPCYWKITDGKSQRFDLAGEGEAKSIFVTVNPKNNERQVYTVGSSGSSKVPCYWTNQVSTKLSDKGIANDIFVVTKNGVDRVYTAGLYYDYEYKTQLACYWINDIPTKLSTGDDVATGIFVVTKNGVDTVYTSGNYDFENSRWPSGCYWKNSERFNAGYTRNLGIFVENDTVYLAGSNTDGNIYIPMCTGIDNLHKEGSVNDVSVVNGTVYAAESYQYNIDMNTVDFTPYYWINNTSIKLAESGSANSIFVKRNIVYVAGSASGYPCYWVAQNNVPQKFDLGENLKGTATGIYVVQQ